MLDMLVNHPSTARFIATKMLKWLLDADSERRRRSATIAAVYRATGGDIKAMIRAILNDTWLAAAPMKLKRPFHFARLGAAVDESDRHVDERRSTDSCSTLGQPLFVWDTPDGYPDKIEYWAGNIVPRWQFGTTLSS